MERKKRGGREERKKEKKEGREKEGRRREERRRTKELSLDFNLFLLFLGDFEVSLAILSSNLLQIYKHANTSKDMI